MGKTGIGGEVQEGILVNETPGGILPVGGIGRFDILRAGEIIESWEDHNLIVSEGLDYLVDAALLGGTAISAWYVLLVDGTPTIDAGDTYATQAGWTEVTDYDEATRPSWTGVAGATGVATNSASRAEFTISTGGATVGGIAVVGGGTDADTKGDTAGGGTLLEALAFSGGDRALQESDVLRVTYQITAADGSA